MDVSVIALGVGPNDWGGSFRFSHVSVFAGRLPPGRLRRFPRTESVATVENCLAGVHYHARPVGLEWSFTSSLSFSDVVGAR